MSLPQSPDQTPRRAEVTGAPTVAQVGRALVAALATLTLLVLGFSLVIPVMVIQTSTGTVTETPGTLWQEGIDHGFTDGGGANALVPAAMLTVVVLATVTAMYLCALLMGGSLGRRGALALRISSVVLLLGGAWMALRTTWLVELAEGWNERDQAATGGPGAWWVLAGAVVLAALCWPRPVRELWTARPRGTVLTEG
ncbi:hypothetical protein [Nocardioides nanhaiensis]|uniref:DUF2567 domain-containing protein n=1 Tax=Nocardioides nanhaiensis TaxID=1476871 RepID=A0ABP8VP98_9ACTN